MKREYVNSKYIYFEVGNGSRHTLKRVPEMMDTPPILNKCAFIMLVTLLNVLLSKKACLQKWQMD